MNATEKDLPVDDIVQELNDWADIIDGTKGNAHLIMLNSAIYREAAQEIQNLRTAITILKEELTGVSWGKSG